MSHYTLYVLELTLFYIYQAMFRQISWFYNSLVKKIDQWCKETSGIPGWFLKQLPLG